MGRGGEVLPSRDSTRIVISDVAKIGIISETSKYLASFLQIFGCEALLFQKILYFCTCICLVRHRCHLRMTEPVGGALHCGISDTVRFVFGSLNLGNSNS